MGNDHRPLVFISYRRIDSAPAARLLSGDLRAVFGLGSVFIDTNDIRIGMDWPARIDERLQAASVLLVVIGPAWLRVADEAGRRRLDKPEDWVRNEIAYAIDNKLVIIPFLVTAQVCIPKALAFVITSLPIWPNPITPSTFPAISSPGSCLAIQLFFQLPCRSCESTTINSQLSASTAIITYSAMAGPWK